MKNPKLRKGKVAIMSVVICILMFSLLFSTSILEYSQNVTKNEHNFLLRDVQASADPSSFISVWNTTLTSRFSSEANQVRLPLISSGTYDFTVNWGDGNNDIITDWNQAEVTHNYSSTGEYEINITGKIVGWRFNGWGDKLKLIEISQWGNLNLGNSGYYFWGCENLNLTTTDVLNLTGTTNLLATFLDCKTLGSSGNLGGWDVSKVINMMGMFSRAYAFDQDIGGWDVSGVTNMGGMFVNADTFNQDIGEWNVSGVTNMGGMFANADTFNQDIGEWNVSGVTNMGGMFAKADTFNQDIGEWNVSGVVDMSSMFSRAYAFNQDIGGWNVSRVTNMCGMFLGTTVFNQDIGGWDVSKVTNMDHMFDETDVFNQDIGGWDVSAVTEMKWMFSGVSLATENYDSLLVGWAELSLQSGVYFSVGNSLFSSVSAIARQYIIDTYRWRIYDNGQITSIDPPVLITSNQTIIKENITIEWNNVRNAATYNIYVNGTINETTSDTSQVVMLWSNGTYSITVTSVIGILESDESEPIIIVVEPPSEYEGYTIPGYSFGLIPTMLLGLAILTLKIRKMKNLDSRNQ